MVRTSGNDIARVGGEGNIRFRFSNLTQGQSVYPDIALHISNNCVYCIEDQNLDTHNDTDRSISACQSVSRNGEGHVKSVQPIKCMLFILIFNNR